MDGDVLRDRRHLFSDLFKRVDLNGGLAPAIVFFRQAQPRPDTVKPVRAIGLIGFARLELGIQEVVKFFQPGIDLVLRDRAFLDQAIPVKRQRGRMLGDRLIHDRLSEAWIITFVMAVAAIAEHVHHHVLAEFLTVLGCDLSGEGRCFGIIAVHMEDRRLNHERHVRRVGRGPAVLWIGGEANLIVDHEMNSAAGAVAFLGLTAQSTPPRSLGRQRLHRHARAGGARCAPC